MELSGVHLLLTYECNYECDHCFTWGSPSNRGTMTLETMRVILKQSEDLGTVETIYFEGGEPFLYYPILLRGIEDALSLGFKIGIVTNSYWATALEDSLLWLEPFAGRIKDLSVSTDLFHADELISEQARIACEAADDLGLPTGMLTILGRDEEGGCEVVGQLPLGESNVMHRGRAAEELVEGLPLTSWSEFDECPFEDLREPIRVHVDPLGHVHICQGLSAGNVFERDLADICESYDPDSDPVFGPLLEGGPAELVRRYNVDHYDGYVDACHICYRVREKLRDRFPDILTPDQMYGIMEDESDA